MSVRAIISAAVIASAIAACKKTEMVAAALPVAERFAVGSHPSYCKSAPLGEAPLCCAEFPASDVIAIESADGGTRRPTIVKEGKFTGTCGGSPLLVAFEGVKVSAVRIDQMSSHVGLKPLELDSAHPEWSISVCAFPLDRRGDPLSIGRGGQGGALWKMRPGCETILRATNFFEDEPPGRGFAWPADSIQLVPIHAGSCTLDVDYHGARGEVAVTTR